MGRPYKDLSGEMYNGIVVQNMIYSDSATLCNCKCICGNLFKTRPSRIVSGTTKSCGCLKGSLIKEKVSKHGKHLHPLYSTWCGMKSRCLNENQKCFERYGQRGIDICERWLDVNNFILDMGDKPSKFHTLERKDNNLGYSPENCVWATNIEQANNKRNSRILNYQGEDKSVSEWARIVNIQASTISYRILHGWTVEDALTIKPKEKK